MKRVLVPLADGFEEIETVTIIDILRRAGIEVVAAGLKPGILSGSRNIKLVPDTELEKVKGETFDAVILPGGKVGVDYLRSDPRVLEILKRFEYEKKMIGAICAAPLALKDAGLIQGRRITSYPAFESDLKGSRYEQSRVVLDGNFITSRSPGTSLEFALKVVKHLAGADKSAEIAAQVLAK